jgi:prepilin-type N-terminal cleavage/methylation domain-containing protein
MRARGETGFSFIEVIIALALIAIVLTSAWGWAGSVNKRRLQNAAYLIEGDLRLAQQMAIANGGTEPQVEVCFRSDGYDLYSTSYGGDPLNIDPTSFTVMKGSPFKSVNRGQEYAAGIQITPPNAGSVSCSADATRTAIAFRSSGQPIFGDSSSHAITVTLRGRSYLVTVQPFTGLAAVSAL